MLQDLAKIHKELEGYVEVDSDYDFPKNVHIKYLTQKKGIRDFCKGENSNVVGQLIDIVYQCCDMACQVDTLQCRCICRICNTFNCPLRLIVKSSHTFSIISEKTLTQTIEYQQSIIEKMTDKIKQLETKNYEMQQTKKQYEQLLQQGRESLQQLQTQISNML